MKKSLILFVLALLPLSSCVSRSVGTEQSVTGFPLRQSAVIPVNQTIKRMAVANSWAVVEVPGQLVAIDTSSQQRLWTLTDISIDEDSEFLINEDMLISATSDDLLIVTRNGHQNTVNLNPARNGVIRLVAVSGEYVYLIRGSDWILEVYDIRTNRFLWETRVGRGRTEVFYDEQADIDYLITSRSVGAYAHASGSLIWQREMNVVQSVFADGILYLCQKVDENGSYELIAIDVRGRQNIWELRFSLGPGVEVYGLSVLGETLVISSRHGVLGVDKEQGRQLWSSVQDEIFYAGAIEFDRVLYARSSSGVVYAISPDDGKVIGYKNLESGGVFQATNDEKNQVSQLADGIAFSTRDSIFIYKAK